MLQFHFTLRVVADFVQLVVKQNVVQQNDAAETDAQKWFNVSLAEGKMSEWVSV